ncbi:MAG TPA: AAA family ATPase [Gaiellaceae bacterium]|nr:AAA family ATPase [Gaiellaceae bacterium]
MTHLASNLEVDLDELTWHRFAELVLARDLEHVASDSWPTERMTLEGVHEHALSTQRDSHERAAVLDIGDDCLVHLSLRRGRAHVYAAARTIPGLRAAKAWLRERYPILAPAEEQKANVTFWSAGARSPGQATRRIDVPTWNEVSANYPGTVAAALAALMSPTFRPGQGQLILWHGEPGTGKTSALRALAREWRSWCRLHYVTDPETFFGQPRYMLDVLLEEPEDGERDLWRLLVLEDTGELLVSDAKERTGQGLSRLLKVVDGLIGQGLRLLVLVTTNEVLRRLHPAVARPGRCEHVVEFTAFTAEEAAAWLERYGSDAAAGPSTLASLYARAAGIEPPRKHPLGFTA